MINAYFTEVCPPRAELLMTGPAARAIPGCDNVQLVSMNPGLINPGLINPGLINSGLINPGLIALVVVLSVAATGVICSETGVL
jgi:hypothetical protein